VRRAEVAEPHETELWDEVLLDVLPVTLLGLGTQPVADLFVKPSA
jgi:hypothetical protein